jgi:hypothetical protein
MTLDQNANTSSWLRVVEVDLEEVAATTAPREVKIDSRESNRR